jgi:ribosomal protein S9
MIAEVSAVLGTLNAVNGAINTLRETRSNIDSVSRVFSRVTDAAQGIAEVEEKARTGKLILSQQEAMQIAMAKKHITDYDRQLKDLFLMTGNMDTYTHMKQLQRDSVAKARKRAAKAKARNSEYLEALQILVIGICIIGIATGGVALWYFMR